MAESKYIDKQLPHSRYGPGRSAGAGDPKHPPGTGVADSLVPPGKEELHQFVPFLTKKCGLEFRGRILEIGAGTAWFSAEISKLPKVVEVVATDFSSQLLREHAPKIFKLLKAHEGKITRIPADFYRLDFQSNHFDFVVCSALLHHGVNVLEVLRESRRVLKPCGQFVAIREPVRRRTGLKRRSKAKATLITAGARTPFYTLAEYRDFFERAGLELAVKRMNFSRGLRYYFKQVVKGLTPAQYTFIGMKRGKE
jgi:ubiquinone/menaquinone biosynthesis C-methylase UbiE